MTFGACEDKDPHGTLIGGITLTTTENVIDYGTLGFHATVDGVPPPFNVVLVSCAHVLLEGGRHRGDTIYQAFWRGDVAQRDRVATVDNEGREGIHNFAYPGEAAATFWIDCATAKLNDWISSLCKTKCGPRFNGTIRGLKLNGSDGIQGVARLTRAEADSGTYRVFKVGRRTGRTVGLVQGFGTRNDIEIRASERNCDGEMLFARKGDSGSALINERSELVGIVYAVKAADPGIAVACHIHPALDLLHVTPITNANAPTTNPFYKTAFDAMMRIDDGDDRLFELRLKLTATEMGRAVWQLVERHREEVVRLVNHCRRVTIAWHRNQGPAFFNRVANNARDPQQRIPQEIAGITQATLIREMAVVLEVHGSEALKAMIAEYREEAFALAGSFDDLHELADRLATQEQRA